jgi:purine-nucleoside phosphorylase
VRAIVNPKTAATRLLRVSRLRPSLALVLGSGFHCVTGAMEIDAAVPYTKLAGFPKSGVTGHRGEALIGKLGGEPVIVLNGRAHYYEGHSMAEVTFPIRVLAEYGVESILITNAAGGINRKFRAGDFMLFKDHINLMPDNPLRGAVPNGLERFVDLTHTYDATHEKTMSAAARAAKATLRHGVYLALPGPNYETPAEVRAFAKLGADAVGMSTVPEVLVARQHGLRVAALSCITNAAAGLGKSELSHDEVLDTVTQVATRARRLLTEFAKHHG